MKHKCDNCYYRTERENGNESYLICGRLWYKNLAEARARCEKSGKCDDYLTVEIAEEMINRFNEIPNN